MMRVIKQAIHTILRLRTSFLWWIRHVISGDTLVLSYNMILYSDLFELSKEVDIAAGVLILLNLFIYDMM